MKDRTSASTDHNHQSVEVVTPINKNVPSNKGRRGHSRKMGKKKLPWKHIAPNIVTMLSLFIGLTGIRMAIELRFDFAVLCIVVSAFLDGIDGRLARLLKSSSKIGAELDSLVDFLTFGVVPGIILYIWMLQDIGALGWIIVLFYAMCAVWRLARFNIMLDEELPRDKRWKADFFSGIPAPAGALLALTPYYIHKTELFGAFQVDGSSIAVLTACTTVVVGCLMASTIPTYSGKTATSHIPKSGVIYTIFGCTLFVGLLVSYPWVTLMSMSLVYCTSMPIGYGYYKIREYRENRE